MYLSNSRGHSDMVDLDLHWHRPLRLRGAAPKWESRVTDPVGPILGPSPRQFLLDPIGISAVTTARQTTVHMQLAPQSAACTGSLLDGPQVEPS